MAPEHAEDAPGVAFINGQFLPRNEAKISIMDSGFSLGMNVVDTLHSYRGHIFRLEDHLMRFYRSAAAVRIPIPYAMAELRNATIEATRRLGLAETLIILLATRGLRSPGSMTSWKPTTIVVAIPYVANNFSAENIERGIKVVTAATRHIPAACLDPDIKTTNRLHYYLAFLEALDAGADEAVLLDLDGHVTESRACNVFAVRNGALWTPSTGILRGITRQTVLEIAEREAISTNVGLLTRYDLYTADEVFFTSTAGGIIPVIEVDKRRIGLGEPGPMTRLIRSVYWALHTDPQYGTPARVARPAHVEAARA